jgi:hypothetical protein
VKKVGRIIITGCHIEHGEIPQDVIEFIKSLPDTYWFAIYKTSACNRITIHVWQVDEKFSNIKASYGMFAQAGAKPLGSVDVVLKFKLRPKVKEKLEKIIKRSINGWGRS